MQLMLMVTGSKMGAADGVTLMASDAWLMDRDVGTVAKLK